MLSSQRRLEDAHHSMMALEATLLAAECCSGELRRKLLGEATSYVVSSETALREADITEILNNRSAVACFGL
jgi:hypothetical protein